MQSRERQKYPQEKNDWTWFWGTGETCPGRCIHVIRIGIQYIHANTSKNITHRDRTERFAKIELYKTYEWRSIHRDRCVLKLWGDLYDLNSVQLLWQVHNNHMLSAGQLSEFYRRIPSASKNNRNHLKRLLRFD